MQRWACWEMVTGARGAGTLGPASSPPSCPGPHGERGGVGRPGEARLAPLRSPPSSLPPRPCPASPQITSRLPLAVPGPPLAVRRSAGCGVVARAGSRSLLPASLPPLPPHRLYPRTRGPPATVPGCGRCWRRRQGVGGVPRDCPPGCRTGGPTSPR